MTDDQIQTIKDDLSYMRDLADQGASGPLLGGSILVAAGLIFGSASIGEWAMSTGRIAADGIAHLYLWGGAGLVFAVALAVLIQRQRRRAGAMSPANRAFGNAWMGVGMAIFSMSVSLTLLMMQTGSGAISTVFPSLIFALYGTGWAVSAAMSGQKWLWRLAFGGWIAAPLMAWVAGQPVMWLVYAVGIVILTLVPGLILMRRQPAGA